MSKACPCRLISGKQDTTMTSRQAEQNANIALGTLLTSMLPTCAVKIENTRVIVGNPGLRPDILITGADRAPVVIEAEFMPAVTAEQEAKDRLALEVVDGRRQIEAAIALRYPEGFEFTDDLSGGLARARLEYAVFYTDDTRFPESGWLRGTPADLADIARLASAPQSAVDAATDALQSGIDRAAAILKDLNEQYPAITQAVAALLGMSDVPQTHRMACAIIANAMVFHDRVADIHGDIKPLRLVCNPNVANPQREIIAEWTRILAINYWPIFAVSRDIIEQIPTAEASRMLRLLEYTAGDVAASGANVEHDLTGRIFQRLIADRKYLATFYTLPASAALLARLAVDKFTNSTTKTPSPSSPPATPATPPVIPAPPPVTPATSPATPAPPPATPATSPVIPAPPPVIPAPPPATPATSPATPATPPVIPAPPPVIPAPPPVIPAPPPVIPAKAGIQKPEPFDWSDPAAIANLRIGDFACGTGALLSAVYEQIAARHEREGGNPANLHKAMMEEVLYGCDVMPSAIHITGSTLSGAQPTVGYNESRLYNMPYGRQPDGTVAIGSLELLQSSSVMTLFNTSDPAMRTGSAGEETATRMLVDVHDEGFDLVIMNPPFTRAGSDWEGIDRAEDAIKQFRGLGTSLDTQKAMSRRLKEFTKDTCYHGYAGIASAFTALGHSKLKPGGVLALVLPLTAAVGLSWDKFRKMLAENYTDISVLSIAANDKDMSFSSDTGMAECLIVARKLRDGETTARTAEFTSFNRRPLGFAHAAALAGEIAKSESVRGVDDGPYGGTPLTVGDDEEAGEMLTAPYDKDGGAWAAVRLLDYSLAQTAYAIANSKLWLPRFAESRELKTVPLNAIGRRGMYDMNIAGKSASAPFTKIASSPTATYPSLWSHKANRETRLICRPDSQLQVKIDMEQKAADVWMTASRVHISRGFRFNSQPLAVAFTEQRTIGGRAWPNVIFNNERYDYAFAVWANSTLGLLSYWWHSNRQVAGRGDITVTSADTLPILDLRALTHAQLDTARDIFDQFRALDLKPAYLADRDPNRALLDRRVLCDMLAFGDDVYQAVRLLAAKWCAEPSVHGGKGR